MPPLPIARALAAAVLAAGAAPARAAGELPGARTWEWETSIGPVVMGGHSTYRIAASDPTGSVESELAFPLSGVAVRLHGELATRRAPGEGRLVLGLAVLQSLAGSGTMEDSDWLSDSVDVELVGAAHPGKDIYSESDAALDALVLEARVAFEVPAGRTWTLTPMGGVLYQRYEYDVTNVSQVGYGPYAADFTGSAGGSVLDYRVRYVVPYVGAGASWTRGRFAASADAWFSPFVSAEDRDDHLLRAKVSTIEASGTAWQLGLGARLALGPREWVQAQAATIRVSATGTQHQRFYAGPDAGLEGFVDATIRSVRNSVLVAYGYRF